MSGRKREKERQRERERERRMGSRTKGEKMIWKRKPRN
jgi:hypothetical protein